MQLYTISINSNSIFGELLLSVLHLLTQTRNSLIFIQVVMFQRNALEITKRKSIINILDKEAMINEKITIIAPHPQDANAMLFGCNL
jgi:hypothetical protein